MNNRRKIAMNHTASRNQGFSLVELMVALVAGLIVCIAVVAFTMSSFKSNSEYVRSTRLTQELRNSLDIITRELRRAGYDENAMGYLATGSGSPFSRMLLGNQISGGPPATYSCVIYAYDRASGVHGTVEPGNGEVRGLRRATATVNGRPGIGIIEYAVSAGTTRPACNGASPNYSVFPITCNSTSKWCALSDPTQLDITGLTITEHRTTVGTAPNQVQLRDLDIALVGRLAGSTEYSRGVKSSVRVRSDCFAAALSNCNLSP